MTYFTNSSNITKANSITRERERGTNEREEWRLPESESPESVEEDRRRRRRDSVSGWFRTMGGVVDLWLLSFKP